jgi:hypothetical protein
LLGYKKRLAGRTMNDDQPFLSDEDNRLRAELKTLQQEHADLDAAMDQLLIARLKRKKLALRDEIVKVENRILPDIIA